MPLQTPRGALRRLIFGSGTFMVPREVGLEVVGATAKRSGMAAAEVSMESLGLNDLLLHPLLPAR